MENVILTKLFDCKYVKLKFILFNMGFSGSQTSENIVYWDITIKKIEIVVLHNNVNNISFMITC